jgi:hypothetical protein
MVISHPVIDKSKIPQNTIPSDDANRPADFTSGPDNFRFSVFGSSQEPGNTTENQLLQKMSKVINENLDMAVFAGTKAAALAKDIKKPALVTGTEYKTYQVKNSTFIQLDISKGGLRRSDPEEWIWLFNELDKMAGSNAFIVMSSGTETFINAKEGQLLRDTLADYQKKTGKNVWVFYQGPENKSQMDRGVRYISCAGFTQDSSRDNAKYLSVTVMGNSISYEFKAL